MGNKKIVRREMPTCFPDLEGVHPILQRVYTARNVRSVGDVDRDLKGLQPYKNMLNIDKAVKRIAKAVKNDEKIVIIGDFDTDGATSTTLMTRALRSFGAKHVDFLIPNRFDYGYGLTPEIVDVAKKMKPNLIITVDNGIASNDGVDCANAAGIDVVITDHHIAPEALPKAFAIVNPNQPGDQFESKCLAGVGVAFYVMVALRAALNKEGWFKEQKIDVPNMAKYLDLVALGTIADVVPLDKNNRILVYNGVRRIQAGQSLPGILAMLQIAKRHCANVVASDLGYAIGPRLNAAGRLEDMSLGVECLLSDKYDDALAIATQLEELNFERRALETKMQNEALSIVDKLQLGKQLPIGICLYDQGWHQGIVGLIAARMKERTSRPIVAFAKVDDDTLKGSARSVKGLHIRDALDNIATKNPGLISKFGGHAMAAGLSIHIDQFEEFSLIFNEEVSDHLCRNDLVGCVESDGPLDSNDFTLDVAEMLREAGPWGQGFPKPLFDGFFMVKEQRLVGEKHLKLTLQVQGYDQLLNGIAFNVDLTRWPNQHCKRIKAAYHIDVNIYQGRRRLQLIVEELEAANITEREHAF